MLSPGVPVISEEGTVPDYDTRAGWRRFWLVDPLDGTKEFLSGNGEFTVNIALIEDNEPVLGVVAAPALDAVYWAARGSGAWRRIADRPPERLRVAAPQPSLTRVVESRSHPSPELEAFLDELGPVERVKLGSSLKFCRIAEAGADLYPRFGRTMEWDVAAGDCVYRNAGPDGCELWSPLEYNQPSLSTAGFVIGQAAQRHAQAGVST
jgi:3'(2'), 5'-bisphosphate nucleotidase